MAPTKFQIYVDQSMRQPDAPVSAPEPPVTKPVAKSSVGSRLRYIPESLKPEQRFFFDEREVYPPGTDEEFSFEELGLQTWQKRQKELRDAREREMLRQENEELKMRLEALTKENQQLKERHVQPIRQIPEPTSPIRRISIVPQSLQLAEGPEYTEMYSGAVVGAIDEAPTTMCGFWTTNNHNNHLANDKFTVPVDQSQYIRENVPTSTPTSKGDKKSLGVRRLSRPSMGGSPTLKLSPITETSRDCNSKSSSSSSALSGTPGTAKKVLEPVVSEAALLAEVPDRPLDPNDPSSYKRLLIGLAEPLERRNGYYRHNRSLPKIRHGACFQAGEDSYLVDKELSKEAKVFTAQLLNDESNDDSISMEIPIKTFCIRVDQPANEWLYYICNELHRRLVRQKTKPDIELSVMIANPAVFYNDGSILIDEYFRFFTLNQFLEACVETKKPFPKSVAAYVALELLQVVRQIHNCGIVHMNISPQNLVFTCCPNRDDVTNVDERTSIVKLIGFERSMDTRLLPQGFKFDCKLSDMESCEMRDGKPWSFEVDWFGVLNCIHMMFFNETMQVEKGTGKWSTNRQFRGCPTGAWTALFEQLLNISDMTAVASVVDVTIDELTAWVKANLSFVLKEAAYLDGILEEHYKNLNKSMRT